MIDSGIRNAGAENCEKFTDAPPALSSLTCRRFSRNLEMRTAVTLIKMLLVFLKVSTSRGGLTLG